MYGLFHLVRKKRDTIRNLLILFVDRFNNIDNRFNNIDNTVINQNKDLLTYMKNINNVTVNYLFSIKKELAELKGNIRGKTKKLFILALQTDMIIYLFTLI